MRIGLVSQEYPPETAHGGIASQTYEKAHGLAILGHEVQVITHSVDGDTHESSDGPVRVTRLPGFDDDLPGQTELVRWITYSAKVAGAIGRIHRRSPFDLIDFPEWGCEGYIFLLNRANWNHVPTVIQLHGPLVMLAHTIGWPEEDSAFYKAGTLMEGLSLQLADAVFSSSHCSARWCAEHYGLDEDRIPVIHTGVDISMFRPADRKLDNHRRIGFVGRIVPSKGVDHLLDAAILISPDFPDLRLKLIGRAEKPFAESLNRRAEDAGFPNLLEMTGPVDRTEIPNELGDCDFFAAPSLYEGGPGFVYLEAMACGLPVVASRGSGAAEVVRHGSNGFLVEPGNILDIAQALRALLSDHARRKRMGRQAREYVESEADSRKCILKLESFYNQVVEDGLAGKLSQKD